MMNLSNASLCKVKLNTSMVAPVGCLVSYGGNVIGSVIETCTDGTAVISLNAQNSVGEADTRDGFKVVGDPKPHIEFSDPFLKKLDHARQKYSSSYQPAPKYQYTGEFFYT